VGVAPPSQPQRVSLASGGRSTLRRITSRWTAHQALVEAPALSREFYPRALECVDGEAMSAHALQVLMVVAEDAQQRASDIARRLQLDPSSVGHALADLRRLKLLDERPDPQDRRRRVRTLTATGAALVERLVRHADDVLVSRDTQS
jgi:DNA-binding MarR family transcriptional regulator